MRYQQAYEGEWITPRKGYKFGCCDCGLVHRAQFRIRNGRIEWRVWRDNRATGQKRRYKGITITTKDQS